MASVASHEQSIIEAVARVHRTIRENSKWECSKISEAFEASTQLIIPDTIVFHLNCTCNHFELYIECLNSHAVCLSILDFIQKAPASRLPNHIKTP